jgi:hypothetical protein
MCRARSSFSGCGGLIFNRAPALPRHSACAFRVPRPKPRLPEKVGTPLRKAARVVRGGVGGGVASQQRSPLLFKSEGKNNGHEQRRELILTRTRCFN